MRNSIPVLPALNLHLCSNADQSRDIQLSPSKLPHHPLKPLPSSSSPLLLLHPPPHPRCCLPLPQPSSPAAPVLFHPTPPFPISLLPFYFKFLLQAFYRIQRNKCPYQQFSQGIKRRFYLPAFTNLERANAC